MSKRLIYAEDAIKAVHDLYAIFGSEGEWVDRKDVFEAIEQLPSAQPECTRECMPMYANVCDTISRQAAIDALEKIDCSDGVGLSALKCDAVDDAVVTIKALPSAQLEIIRCKDCKYWVVGYITEQDDFIPPRCGKYQQMVGHSSDDFCSYAERRQE